MENAPVTLSVNPNDPFQPLLALVEVRSMAHREVTRGIGAWAQVLPTAKTSILKRAEFKNRDPWFGFGLSFEGTVFDEKATLEQVTARKAPPSVVAFVEAIIDFNTKHRSFLEGGLVTHEELETGTFAAEWLVQRDLSFLPLYLQFLATLDLDHTVEQVNVLFRLAKRYDAAQLRPLTEWCRAHHASLLSSWLENDRVWKPASTAAPKSAPHLSAQPLYAEGMRLMQSGKLAEARKVADKAVAIAPLDLEVLYLDLRLAWREANAPAAALEQAGTRLEQLDPSQDLSAAGRLFNLLGCACDELKQWPASLEWFQKAAAADPTEATYLANLAEVHEKLGDLGAAREAAKRARKLGADSPVVTRLTRSRS